MTHRLSHLILVSIVVGSIIPETTRAAIFCATSSLGLQFALGQASANFEDDEIRIAQGTYPILRPPFVQRPFTFSGGSAHNGDNNDLIISGGWISFGGNPCGRLRSDASAFDTILDGQGLDRVMHIDVGEQANVTISGLTFLNGSGPELELTQGAGLDLGSVDETGGTFTVQRSAFVANQATMSSGAWITKSRTVRFINNLVVGNRSEGNGPAVDITQINQNGVYVINNTIVNNFAGDNPGGNAVTGLRIRVEDSSQALIANNILWGNEVNDVRYEGSGFTISRNNTIESAVGAADSEQDNQSIAPVFEDGGFLNFRLVPESLLANEGLNPPSGIIPFPPPFDLNWSLPDRDLDGSARITNGRVDIGALETRQDGIFSDRFN